MNKDINKFKLLRVEGTSNSHNNYQTTDYTCIIQVGDPELNIIYTIFYSDYVSNLIITCPSWGPFEKYNKIVEKVCRGKYNLVGHSFPLGSDSELPIPQTYTIVCNDRMTMDDLMNWCINFVKQLNEDGETFISSSRQDQKEQIKKLLAYLEYNQIKVSKNKILWLGNHDIQVSMILYDGLVEAFGRELVEEAMTEVFGVKQALIRIADTPTPLKVEDN